MTYTDILNSDTPLGDLSLSDSQRKALAIIGDLTDRKGLKHEWENIDEEFQDEIFQTWTDIIARDAAPKEEASAVEKVKALEDMQHHMYDRAEDYRQREYQVACDIDALVAETVHQIFPEIDKDSLCYRASGWECGKPLNPFPKCVYDEDEDPCLDDCLFCHQPYERK